MHKIIKLIYLLSSSHTCRIVYKKETHVINGEAAAIYDVALFLRLVINNCVSSHMWLMVIRTVCKNYLITPRVSNARKIRCCAAQQLEYPDIRTLNRVG